MGGYRIVRDDEIYHSHKYVAKAKVGNGTRYFYSTDEYRQYLTGRKHTIRPIGEAIREKAMSSNNSSNKPKLENRPKAREKNVTNDGKGAAKREGEKPETINQSQREEQKAVTANRPKAREKNVTNNGTGAKKRDEKPAVSTGKSQREEQKKETTLSDALKSASPEKKKEIRNLIVSALGLTSKKKKKS